MFDHLVLDSVPGMGNYLNHKLQETMAMNIQQIEDNPIGSFSVKASSGDDYSGIIFGTIIRTYQAKKNRRPA